MQPRVQRDTWELPLEALRSGTDLVLGGNLANPRESQTQERMRGIVPPLSTPAQEIEYMNYQTKPNVPRNKPNASSRMSSPSPSSISLDPLLNFQNSNFPKCSQFHPHPSVLSSLTFLFFQIRQSTIHLPLTISNLSWYSSGTWDLPTTGAYNGRASPIRTIGTENISHLFSPTQPTMSVPYYLLLIVVLDLCSSPTYPNVRIRKTPETFFFFFPSKPSFCQLSIRLSMRLFHFHVRGLPADWCITFCLVPLSKDSSLLPYLVHSICVFA